MTRKHYVEEYKEAIDTRAMLSAFAEAGSATEAPAPAEPTAESKAVGGE